jgi:hypothetical protein
MAVDVNVLEISSWSGFTEAGVGVLRTWEAIESVHGEPSADGRYRKLTILARSAEDAALLKQSIQEFDAREALN